MRSFSFVILNFHTSEDTVKCIESILYVREHNVNVSIVIVDNGSTDTEIQLLKSYIGEIHGASCILLEMHANLGFSKANNIGYKYAKEHCSPDFIAISNSDIIIRQPDFFFTIFSLYDKELFSILGPDIYVPRKKLHQSPVLGRRITEKKFVEKEIIKCKQKIELLEKLKKSGKTKAIIDGRSISRIKNYLKNAMCTILHFGYRRQYTGEYIHGAFVVCAPPFIQKYDKCFEPEVFLYGEEDMLHYKCLINNEKLLYSPKVRVLHFSGGTSSGKPDTNIDKQLFYWKNELKSKEVLYSQFK